MYAFSSNYDSDPDYGDSDFCCYDIAFVKLVPKESVVVAEPEGDCWNCG